MIKDAAAKLLLIPLFSLFIPISTNFFSCSNCVFYRAAFTFLLYIAVTLFIWQGVVALTAFTRNNPYIRKRIALKVLLLIAGASLFSFIITGAFVQLLYYYFADVIQYRNAPYYTVAYLVLAPVITLTYEILFLQKEQELDSKIVAQLDYERQSAELNVLKAELDPHFIFNSLNTLAPLIVTETAKAQVFTTKLAQTYKYLLLKKDRELISLGEELRFIEDYFFLLQIRHEHKLKLQIELNEMAPHKVMILPFALQLLIENAIKHNQFSETSPLVINITLTKQFIQVSNTVHPKTYGVESTYVGLKNLSARYRLTCNRDIIIYQTPDTFLVKLPLIKTTI